MSINKAVERRTLEGSVAMIRFSIEEIQIAIETFTFCSPFLAINEFCSRVGMGVRVLFGKKKVDL